MSDSENYKGTIDFNAKRVCGPRRSRYRELGVIVADVNTQRLYNEDGETFDYSDALALMAISKPSMIVGWQVGLFVKHLHNQLQNDELWQARVTPVERDVMTNKGDFITVNHGVVFSFIGMRESTKRKSWAWKHHPLDPALFTTSFKPEYQRTWTVQDLMQWGCDLRAFLKDNDLTLRATQAGIAAQLLTDKRFYPEPRRKVPHPTNEHGRRVLPGNYYSHGADVRTVYSAIEIDQISAHHSCARDLALPDANSLYAKGYFHTLADIPLARAGRPLFERLLNEHGLFYVRVKVHPYQTNDYPLPTTERHGSYLTFVFSNELNDLRERGVQIEYIVAAWTSPDRDAGLNRLASWSLTQLQINDRDRTRWLKPLLLSCYGLLASRSRPIQTGYIRGDRGDIVYHHLGRGETMPFLQFETERSFESPFVNTIHRGMIEAECRLRSLKMARWMHSLGFRVLSIYADAVYVTGDAQLPLLPNGWKARAISGAHFPNVNQIVCDQFVKLPGLTGAKRELLARQVRTA